MVQDSEQPAPTGSHSQWETLIEGLWRTHYAPTVRALTARSWPKERSEDAVQQVFFLLLKEPTRIAGVREFGPFIFVAAKRVLIDGERQYERLAGLHELAHLTCPPSPPTKHVERLLASTSARERLLIQKKFFDGQTCEEIARDEKSSILRIWKEIRGILKKMRAEVRP